MKNIKRLVVSVGAIVGLALFGCFGRPGPALADVTPDKQQIEDAMTMILSNSDGIKQAQGECLKTVGGGSSGGAWDKITYVSTASNTWGQVTNDIVDWLVNGDSADSRTINIGFLTITTTNSTSSTVSDFNGVDIAPGGVMQMGVPSSKLGILRGCLVSKDADRASDKQSQLAVWLGKKGIGTETLLQEVAQYKTSIGSSGTDQDYSGNAVDIKPTVAEPGGQGGGSSSGAANTTLSKLYGYLGDSVKLLSVLIGAALVGSTIFAGIQYTSAGADAAKVQKAKGRLASNVIVLVLYTFSATILNWILPG